MRYKAGFGGAWRDGSQWVQCQDYKVDDQQDCQYESSPVIPLSSSWTFEWISLKSWHYSLSFPIFPWLVASILIWSHYWLWISTALYSLKFRNSHSSNFTMSRIVYFHTNNNNNNMVVAYPIDQFKLLHMVWTYQCSQLLFFKPIKQSVLLKCISYFAYWGYNILTCLISHSSPILCKFFLIGVSPLPSVLLDCVIYHVFIQKSCTTTSIVYLIECSF